ncbi:MAG: DUF3095 domain-containing protein [Rhodovibrionaceae bacterium]
MTGASPAAGEDFYRALTPFSRFADFTDTSHYRPVPDDWIAVVADIESSTEAIQAGHYKRVNMIGAGVIVAVLNACPDAALPYVFGGDGATLLIPPRLEPVVIDALQRTRRFAESAFGLTLRVGIVPLAELKRRGAEVHIAKYQLSPGNDLAMFSGHGVELAERLVKDAEDGSFRLPASDDEAPPDLEGLSCRWEPLASARGIMLTALVRGTASGPEENALFAEVVEKIEGILAPDANPSPASVKSLRFRFPPSGARLEALANSGRQGFWRALRRVYFESFVYLLFQKFNLSAGGFNARRYTEELRTNTDFRKFDDMLRMVLDCSEEEAARIEGYLAEQRGQGRLAYGLHHSEEALMTCVVFSLAESRHVHFIDGADGGYALAARQLKAQMREDAA